VACLLRNQSSHLNASVLTTKGALSSRTTLGATGAETFAAQHWASWLRLERNTVGLAALITDNFESLALASALASSTEICSSRVPARFATFGMGQSALAIVILFSFSKRKARSTLGAGDL
jgi:hypothetical protein